MLLPSSVLAQTQTRGPVLPYLYGSYAVAQALDIDSTMRFRSLGKKEGNGLMVGCVTLGLRCLLPVKAAATAGILLAVDRLSRPVSREAAVATMIGLNVLQWAVTGHNYAIYFGASKRIGAQ